jgi:hypothetical protein
MATKLDKSLTILVLADDLGLSSSCTPVSDIVTFCKKKVRQFLAEFNGCAKPSELLGIVANKLGTLFVEIHSDAEMKNTISTFVGRGEIAFANLASELAGDVYGITLKLMRAARFDLPYVSAIDCRDSKSKRSYFTKWHELGHLLILTDQRRLAFRRTHSLHEPKSPEESLVDILAGEFAYYAPMIRPLAHGEISFEKIGAIRDEVCPDGSFTSATIGVAKAWPHPCILLEARLASKKGDGNPDQGTMAFVPPPVEELRAVHVAVNGPARRYGIQMPPHFRVPKPSVIARVFQDQLPGGEAVENLDWWRASKGTQLRSLRVIVRAKRIGQSVYALLIPQVND